MSVYKWFNWTRKPSLLRSASAFSVNLASQWPLFHPCTHTNGWLLPHKVLPSPIRAIRDSVSCLGLGDFGQKVKSGFFSLKNRFLVMIAIFILFIYIWSNYKRQWNESTPLIGDKMHHQTHCRQIVRLDHSSVVAEKNCTSSSSFVTFACGVIEMGKDHFGKIFVAW